LHKETLSLSARIKLACRGLNAPPGDRLKGEVAMSLPQGKKHTILCFCCNDDARLTHAALLHQGYHVLASSNGFEIMELCTREPVDAVVLDLDRNCAEVALIARTIKQCRPQVPTIVLAETPAPVDGLHELAHMIVPRADHAELVRSLQKLLTA
jgi:CheY-like chemotaxis protein